MIRAFRSLQRHWLKLLISAPVIVFVLAAVLVFWTGDQIASPPRRALMDYHREFLADAESHGVSVARFTASDGTPCLVCTPLSSGLLGERGKRIREQLDRRGLQLQPAGHVIGNLLLCHGRKGRKEDYLPVAERLCAVGFRCVIPDLPAHGENPKTFTTYGVTESSIPSLVLKEASEKFSFEAQPAGLLGMSMGGSVAIHAAALPYAPWKALVVISSFDRFSSAIECQASGYAGGTLGHLWAKATDSVYRRKSGFSIDDIQPCMKAPSIHIPVMVAHGTNDQVSPSACGKRLFNSFTTVPEKRWVEVPGATHDNVLITDYPIYADIAGWMLLHVSSR